MEINLLVSVFILSVLHGFIPSHWTPVMVLKKKHKWSFFQTFKVTSILNTTHVLSTVIIGSAFSLISSYIGSFMNSVYSVKIFSSLVLLVLGIYFIYRHYYHHHFHLYHEKEIMKQKDLKHQIIALNIGMLFSPCMEITGLYFVGGMMSWTYVLFISGIYFVVSFVSSLFWIFFFDKVSEKMNFHKIEHNSGLLSGISLLVSAILVLII